MKATALIARRVVLAPDAFAEIVIWRLPQPLPPCTHRFKYRLAYIVDGNCVLRYDNERGKGDHYHTGKRDAEYHFTTPEQLMADFNTEIARWNDENSRA
jgi:hypothetical protein